MLSPISPLLPQALGEKTNRAVFFCCSYAMDVIRECAEAWEKLMTGKTPAGNVST